MPHGDVSHLRKQGIRSFVQLPRFVASRVRAGDDVARRCFLDGRDSRVSVSKLDSTEECGRRRMSPDSSSHDMSSTAATN